MTPELLLPGQGSLTSTPPRGTLLVKPGRKKCDPEWVWPRCSGKGPGVPVRALGVGTPGPRPASKVRTRARRAGPRSPYALPQRYPAQGSVLPGPRMGETHFRRIHDLPRLLLSLAAGAGHRDNGTGGDHHPSSQASVGQAKGAFPAVSALRSQYTRSDSAWKVDSGNVARSTALPRSRRAGWPAVSRVVSSYCPAPLGVELEL